MSLPATLMRPTIPATAGATSAAAPMVAIHPPSTDIHEVAAGRTKTLFAIVPSFDEVAMQVVQDISHPAGGQGAKRALSVPRWLSRAYRRGRCAPTENRGDRNVHTKRSAGRSAAVGRTAR